MKTWNSISQSFEKFTRGWKEGGVARAMCLSHLQIQKPVEQPPLRGHVVALDLGACPGDGSVARLTLCGRSVLYSHEFSQPHQVLLPIPDLVPFALADPSVLKLFSASLK